MGPRRLDILQPGHSPHTTHLTPHHTTNHTSHIHDTHRPHFTNKHTYGKRTRRHCHFSHTITKIRRQHQCRRHITHTAQLASSQEAAATPHQHHRHRHQTSISMSTAHYAPHTISTEREIDASRGRGERDVSDDEKMMRLRFAAAAATLDWTNSALDYTREPQRTLADNATSTSTHTQGQT